MSGCTTCPRHDALRTLLRSRKRERRADLSGQDGQGSDRPATCECESRPVPSTASIVVIPGYTEDVKTAISLPDDTYEQATRQAAELGISRSEFFARAARSYLDQLAAHSLTRQINEALQTTEDNSTAAAAAAGRRYLAGQDDW